MGQQLAKYNIHKSCTSIIVDVNIIRAKNCSVSTMKWWPIVRLVDLIKELDQWIPVHTILLLVSAGLIADAIGPPSIDDRSLFFMLTRFD